MGLASKVLQKWCNRTIGVLQSLSSTGSLLCETFCRTFLQNPKGSAAFWGTFVSPDPFFEDQPSFPPFIREVPDTFNFLRHVMRAILSVQPKCSHRCFSLKESPLKHMLILKHATKRSAEQTSAKTEWFKQIAIFTIRHENITYPKKNIF